MISQNHAKRRLCVSPGSNRERQGERRCERFNQRISESVMWIVGRMWIMDNGTDMDNVDNWTGVISQ